MKYLLAPLVLALAAAGTVTAAEAPATKPGPASVSELTTMAKRFAPVELRADTSKLSKGDRAAIAKLVEAAKIVDTLQLRQRWASNEALWAALQKVAEEGRGVVVVLANHESSQALLERIPQLTQAPRQYTRSQSRIYSEVGTGAQILQDIGVGKLRHLGPPLKYAGLTGYDLEVVESIPFPGTEQPASS